MMKKFEPDPNSIIKLNTPDDYKFTGLLEIVFDLAKKVNELVDANNGEEEFKKLMEALEIDSEAGKKRRESDG